MNTRDRDAIIWGLVQQYTRVVSQDHHKTQDGYFAIRREYRAWPGWGTPAGLSWCAEHYGYLDEWDEEFDTLAEAQEFTIAKLRAAIADWREHYNNGDK